ncbi:SLATT domain-containing protein [Cellulomonas sp. URHD0024]|uniref:SLATT domain-containing protein n=1 Tax=Cellulomonas sp. URHD0024 TaxID=1302620 RepID=UPI00068673C7|nr:SLATT domain-containing protein [Cellulomonas sp. URHD0024]
MGPTLVRVPQGGRLRPRDLGVPSGRPVVALFGSTNPLEPELAATLAPLVRELLLGTALRRGVVVTGGTDAGVFALAGASSLAVRPAPPLVGVAPAALVDSGDVQGGVPLEPHHHAVALVAGTDWGDELPAISDLVDAVAGRRQVVVCVLVGGGPVSRTELREHLRRGRTVLVVAGSGRLADDVLSGRATDGDPELAALLDAGLVIPVDRAGGADAVREALETVLGPVRPAGRAAALDAVPRRRVRTAPATHLLPPDAAVRYPNLATAIAVAEQVVAPALRVCDATALREQNRHRWIVTLGLVGGLATTTLGAVQSWLTSAAWPGVALAAVGAATSGLLTISRRQGALDSYVSARTRAERLRSLYFEFVTTMPQRAGDDAVAKLREETARRRYGLPAAPASNAQASAQALLDDASTQPVQADAPPPAPAGTPASWPAEALDLYRRHRLEEQARWYEQRSRRLETGLHQTVTASALLLVCAALFGGLGVADPLHRAAWACVAAFCGALAAATNTYEAMSGFGTLSRRYDDTAGALRLAAARASSIDVGDGRAVDSFIAEAEAIQLGEVGTWSMLLRQSVDDTGTTPPKR